MLTIQSDNGKQGYKVGGKKHCRHKAVLSRQPRRPISQRLDSETRGILSSQREECHGAAIVSALEQRAAQTSSGYDLEAN